MKVLWFTNNSVNLGVKAFGGGWMQQLEHRISTVQDIQLSIATRINGKKILKSNVGRTEYYLLPDTRSILKKRFDQFLNKEPVDLFLRQNLDLIADLKPDVIHVFGTEMDYGLISGISKIPVIVHIQGVLNPICYVMEKNSIKFTNSMSAKYIIDTLKGNTFNNSLRIMQRRKLIEKEIFSNCQFFIGRTDWDRKITKLFAPSAKYFHCEEMIGNEYFDANWIGNDNKCIHLVSISANPFYKGHDTLVATAHVLKDAGIEFIWHIIGIDKNDSIYRLFYKKQLHDLSDDIVFHGKLKKPEIIDIFRQSQIYVHPSHIENSSNSICEAMALGMPVIALHVGGNASMIEDGVDGLLVSDNDPYSLAESIISMAKDKGRLRELGQSAKLRAIARHNPDYVVSSLLDIYSKVILDYENSR